MKQPPTPETDQWEAYCDECYYHMWRLRRKTERGWHDGFHINTGEEARGLCDLLNNLERERNELKALLTKKQGAVTISRNGYVQELERERDEARGQRDRLAEALKNCRDDLEMILLERLPNPSETWCSLCDADAALQSLTPNETLSQ